MTISLVLGAAYLGQLWLKARLALALQRREAEAPPADLVRVTVVQAVLSGDEQLEAMLAANLRELPGAAVIWVVDRTDHAGVALAQQLRAAHPATPGLVLETDEPAAGFSPKTWKLAAALPHVATEYLVVLDDDTRLPRASLDALIAALRSGADLATGLPSYVPARGYCSLLLAEFVNSAAILTYLSAAAVAAPRTINGMCYAVRTNLARERDLFHVCRGAVTDDLAVARAIRRQGGTIVQTTRPQHISTTVTGATHYGRLMHRWFVFTRLLVRSETPLVRALVVLAYGLHPLVLLALVVAAGVDPATGLAPLLVVLVVRALALAGLNRRFTGAWRHAPLASVLAELVQPFFLLRACVHPVIWWRTRHIRVHAFDRFDYLSP